MKSEANKNQHSHNYCIVWQIVRKWTREPNLNTVVITFLCLSLMDGLPLQLSNGHDFKPCNSMRTPDSNFKQFHSELDYRTWCTLGKLGWASSIRKLGLHWTTWPRFLPIHSGLTVIHSGLWDACSPSHVNQCNQYLWLSHFRILNSTKAKFLLCSRHKPHFALTLDFFLAYQNLRSI